MNNRLQKLIEDSKRIADFLDNRKFEIPYPKEVEEYCHDCDKPIYENNGRYRINGKTKCLLCGDREVLTIKRKEIDNAKTN